MYRETKGVLFLNTMYSRNHQTASELEIVKSNSHRKSMVGRVGKHRRRFKNVENVDILTVLLNIFGSYTMFIFYKLEITTVICIAQLQFDRGRIKHCHIEGSVHKGSISRNPNFSGNEFLCFASFTS